MRQAAVAAISALMLGGFDRVSIQLPASPLLRLILLARGPKSWAGEALHEDRRDQQAGRRARRTQRIEPKNVQLYLYKNRIIHENWHGMVA